MRWGPLEIGDLTDPVALDAAFARHRPVAVVHFAALAYVGESVDQPDRYYSGNVVGSLTLLNAMRRNGIDAIIFSSTCATYGVPEMMPLTETHPQAPINPYGNTKLAVERMLADYATAYGLRPVILRYFNAAGADPEAEIGECHEPETHLIPLVLEAALGLRDHVMVFGDDYPTPDGTCIRDYIHVNDLAGAHLLALERLLAGGSGLVANLGTGTGHSVLEVIDAATRVAGRAPKVIRTGRRPGDPPILVADSSVARRELGWAIKINDIDVIVAHACGWLRRQQGL